MTGFGYGRVAAAPISWGVCEVPGWGHQMQPARVLAEMRELGVAATEFGPPGFLPADPGDRARTLQEHELAAVGGFLALVLHEPGHDPMPQVDAELAGFAATGADTMVLAAATGQEGYEDRVTPTEEQWRALLARVDEITDRAADRGVRAVLHPHVGTVVERPDDVARVLDRSTVPLCLDTGHLLVGGTDPVALCREAAGRIGHAHLKDVRQQLVDRLRAGSIGYATAVREGLYAPLGAGDVDISAVVRSLAAVGFAGWYVLEQDCVLDEEPPHGAGPRVDVADSLRFLADLTVGAGDDR